MWSFPLVPLQADAAFLDDARRPQGIIVGPMRLVYPGRRGHSAGFLDGGKDQALVQRNQELGLTELFSAHTRPSSAAPFTLPAINPHGATIFSARSGATR